jgi:hypothetical protein
MRVGRQTLLKSEGLSPNIQTQTVVMKGLHILACGNVVAHNASPLNREWI